MPTVREIEAAGYRSLRSLRFPVGPLSVFVGGNGTGKTNLYRVLSLLQAAAAGSLTPALAAEGGMESVLWAGARRRGEPARVRLSAELSDDATGHTFPTRSRSASCRRWAARPTGRPSPWNRR